MIKVFTSCVLGLGLSIAATSAFGAGPVQKSPVQAPPAPMAARSEGGYRTFSYEPAPAYRSYGRTGGLRQPSFLDARSKALGR